MQIREAPRNLLIASLLIVDDSAEWRGRVREMLEKQPGLQIVAEAFDGFQAVRKAAELGPDMVLLDIGMPELNSGGGKNPKVKVGGSIILCSTLAPDLISRQCDKR